MKINQLCREMSLMKIAVTRVLPLLLMLVLTGCSSPEEKSFNTILTHYDMVIGSNEVSIEQVQTVGDEVKNFIAMYPSGIYTFQAQEMADRLSKRKSEVRYQQLKKRIQKLMALDGAEYLEVFKDGWGLLKELSEFSSMPDYPNLEIELKAKLGSGRSYQDRNTQ